MSDIRDIFISISGDETGNFTLGAVRRHDGYERVIDPVEVSPEWLDAVLAAMNVPAISTHVVRVQQNAVNELLQKIKRLEAQAAELPALRARLAELS